VTKKVEILIAKQFFRKTLSNKGLFVLLAVFMLALVYVTVSSWSAFEAHHHTAEHFQDQSRESWEGNPDKHPHRMAHFGSFTFRLQHPLSIFDAGIETYTGNSIFLEAHKQHTANFSEASLSTGLVRFGDLDIAMLLLLILPLIIFFIGYSSITAERENGTLKIMYLQGASIGQVLLGKSLGLFLISSLFFAPALLSLLGISFLESNVPHSSVMLRSALIASGYLVFYIILSCMTVMISAISGNSNRSLLNLLGLWLLLFIIVPKTAQVAGNTIFPNLSKIEFKAAVEAELAKTGDSHDPDDPYFNMLRDSVLQANAVDDVKDLPFNYSGFIMSKGEEQTAKIYKQEHDKLMESYRSQNSVTNALVLLNPYLAIKTLSMSLAGSDFETYAYFLTQTEKYRYEQSQYLNKLQMEFISNKAESSEGKVHVVDKEYWQSLPEFTYEFVSVGKTLRSQVLCWLSLYIWGLLALLMLAKYSNRSKLI